MTERRMWAYYYAFTPTGVDDIDAILEAVAIAGIAYHNTEYWADRDEDGNSLAGNIQNAANNAAEALKAPPRPMTEAAIENPAVFMSEVRELLNYYGQGASNGYTLDNELGVTRCDNCDEIYEPTLGHVNRDCAFCAHNSKLSAMLARLEPAGREASNG